MGKQSNWLRYSNRKTYVQRNYKRSLMQAQNLRTFMQGARNGRELTVLVVPYILTIQNEASSGTSIEHRCTASAGVAMLSLENGHH